MSTVSHRDLRNGSGEVLRAVARGESYVVTNHGTAVARIVPVDSDEPDLRCVRPAVSRGFSDLPRRSITHASADILDDFAGER